MKSTKLVLVLMLVLLVLLGAVPMVSAAPEGKARGGDVTGGDSTSGGELEVNPDKSSDGIKCFKNLCWAIE